MLALLLIAAVVVAAFLVLLWLAVWAVEASDRERSRADQASVTDFQAPAIRA